MDAQKVEIIQSSEWESRQRNIFGWPEAKLSHEKRKEETIPDEKNL